MSVGDDYAALQDDVHEVGAISNIEQHCLRWHVDELSHLVDFLPYRLFMALEET